MVSTHGSVVPLAMFLVLLVLLVLAVLVLVVVVLVLVVLVLVVLVLVLLVLLKDNPGNCILLPWFHPSQIT